MSLPSCPGCCWPRQGSGHWAEPSGLSALRSLTCTKLDVAVFYIFCCHAGEVLMVSSTTLFPTFLLMDHFPSFSCLGAGWCPWLYARAALSVDGRVLQTAWCLIHTRVFRDGTSMFLSTTTVVSYFGSPLLLALSEQMLKVFLFSCVTQSVVLFREQMMSWFTEHGHLVQVRPSPLRT